jgi:hypothetical protein
MAKFEKASDDVKLLFEEVLGKTAIPQWVVIEVLCNDKQKNDPCKLFKANDLLETLTNTDGGGGINFVVVINEEIFGQLPEDMQKIAIDECLAGVGVSDADVLTLEKPNFNTHTGVLAKYGDKPIIVLHESIKSLYDAKKQQEDEEKAQKKGKKSRKPKEQ